MSDPLETTRASYDAVADLYVEHIYAELAQKPLDRQFLNRFAEEVLERGLTADLGCGPGHVTRYLREQGAAVLGVDLAPEMVRQATQLNPSIEFRVGDMRSLDLADGELAGIIAFYSLIHLDEHAIGLALREFHRVLEPRGVVLLAFHVGDETVHVDDLWGQRVSLDFRFLLPSRMIEHLKGSGFAVTESIEREPYEGGEYPSRRCYLFARSPGAA